MELTINLDGFHNRTVDGWRVVTSRIKGEPTLVPERYDPKRMRTIPARTLPATDLVTRSSWRSSARKHAAEHGAAGVFHCDDSFTLFYRDEAGEVRQKSWKQARILKTTDRPASFVDVGTITEYGLTQRLSNTIRCF